MRSAIRRYCLLLVLAGLSSGCASTAKYPFREKPRPPAQAAREKSENPDEAYMNTLARDLNLYSD